ncbi:MAG TPA: carboxypeptidase regulatory-like domain-containing protein [Acidobacteriaceae bacterium]
MTAQSARGVVTGLVQDATGAIVPNADVTLRSPAQGTTTVVHTNSAGIYRFEAVNPGDYVVSVVVSGFSKSEVPATVNVGDTVGRDFKLVVGSSAETIEVATTTLELQTEDAVRGGTITTQQLAELPLAGQNSLNLILTNPGVARSNQSGSLDSGIGAVNGARARSNNFLIDGLQNNDISVAGPQLTITNNDQLSEVNFQTSNFSPEFGRAGGAVVSQVTKSGTDRIHGTVAAEYRSQFFNASTQTQRNAYVSNLATYNSAIAAGNLNYPVPALKNKFHEIIPAATIGGPLVIPHLYNGHGRTFIFGGGQMDRFVSNSLGTFSNVSTAAGIATLQALSASCPNVAFYLGLLQAAGNPTGSSTGVGVSSVSIAVPTSSLAAAPTCNGTDRAGQTVQVGQYYRFARDVSQDDNFLVRLDHRASGRQDMMFRYLFDDSNEILGGVEGLGPQFDVPFRGRTQGAAFTDIYQVRNNLVNEFRLGFVRGNYRFDIPSDHALAQTLPAYGFSGTGVVNIPSVSSSFNQGRISNNFEYEDVVTYIHGHHAFKAGAEIQRQLAIQVAPFNGRGQITYTACTATNCSGGGITTAVSALANFIDGYAGPSTGPVAKLFDTVNPTQPGKYRPNLFSMSYFLQDTWKVTSDLSIVYGVRYENFGQPANGTFTHPAFAGYGATDYTGASAVNKDNNNLGPTFGFSYQPHLGNGLLNGRTVIRGGYQVTYDTFFNNLLSNMKGASPNSPANLPVPSTPSATTPRGLTGAPALLASSTPTLTPYTSESSDFKKNLRNPYYHHFSLGVQEELPGRIVLDMAYVGSLGRQLFFTDPLNPAVPNATFTQTATQTTPYGSQTLRVDAARGVIQLRDGGLTSNYHSAQVQLRHRGLDTMVGHFYFTSSYTFSKSLDVLSETFATNSSGQNPSRSPVVADIRSLDYGPSDNDRRHIWNTVVNYQIRGPHAGFMERVLGGWSIAPILTIQSGTPFTVLNGADRDLDGSTIGDRADIGNKNAPFNSRAMVSTTCASGLSDGATGACTTRDQVRFVQVTAYNLKQTQGRNSQYTTRYLNLDTNFLKKISITEGVKAEVRATMLNVTNNQNFDTPSAYTNISTYGATSNFLNYSLANGGSRTMRLGAKIIF